MNVAPLVGAPAARFETSGIAFVPATTRGGGGKPGPPGAEGLNGLGPTAEEPAKMERPLVDVVPNPNCEPMSRAKERDAATTPASIYTCCALRSSWRIRLSTAGSTEGMSRMMMVLERSSARISPRDDKNRFRVSRRAEALLRSEERRVGKECRSRW